MDTPFAAGIDRDCTDVILSGPGAETTVPFPELPHIQGIDIEIVENLDVGRRLDILDFATMGVPDQTPQDRVLVHRDHRELLDGGDFEEFLSKAAPHRTTITVTGCEPNIHPYKYLSVGQDSVFQYLLSMPDSQRGFRQSFPKTFCALPYLIFVPGGLSIGKALQEFRITPFFPRSVRSAAGNFHESPRAALVRAVRSIADTSDDSFPLELPGYTNRLGMEFVRLPGGRFRMGTPKTAPFHDIDEAVQYVEIDPIWVQTTPVTQAQYHALMSENPSRFKGCDLPVHGISVFDAVDFVAELECLDGLHYRLPREHEWEYACRGGNTGRVPRLVPEEMDRYAWFRDNSRGRPQPVRCKQANLFGLYDMLGNVRELTMDVYELHYNPDRAALERSWEDLWFGTPIAVRGGNFNSPLNHLRAEARSFIVAMDYSPNPGIGFRVCFQDTPEEK